jgi:RNA polymerase sigma-70 factor (ECF subfamily)
METSLKKPSSDEALVSKAQAGDLEAMDALVSIHHESVYRVAFSILRDPDKASDAAQDTFLKAFRGLQNFRREASFKTWIHAIAANEARGLLRKEGRRRELALDDVGPVRSEAAGADKVLERDEEGRRVKDLLALLPEKQREAVTLRLYGELSFREIGATIGSSEGAARVNYHHGIKRLREMMK